MKPSTSTLIPADAGTDLGDQVDRVHLPVAQPIADEADIDQVEANHQQAVGASRQLRVLAEAADQEDLAMEG